jgi:hypothetical protein
MTLKLNGSTDGSVSIDAPADTSPTGSDITLTLPTTTGSANQFVKNGGTAGELEYSSMVETSTGIGIGETTPLEKLHVSGASGVKLNLESTSTTGTSGIQFGDPDDINVGRIQYEHNGNYMYFETDGDGEAMRLDSSGRLLVGASSSMSSNSDVKIEAVSTAGGEIHLGRNDTTVTDGNGIGSLRFYGNDSNGAFQECARINCQADGTHATGDKPSRLNFFTTPSGSSISVERLRIGRAGLSDMFSSTSVMRLRTGLTGTSGQIFGGFNGAAGIGSGTQSILIYANGNVLNTNNSYGSISDVKLKENIVDARSQWDDIKDIRVRNYNFIEGQTHTQIGVVAQEVETVSPGLVTEAPDVDAEGNDLGTVTKSVNYSVLYMKAVKALQEAITRIETLEAKVAALEAG